MRGITAVPMARQAYATRDAARLPTSSSILARHRPSGWLQPLYRSLPAGRLPHPEAYVERPLTRAET
jgi:hypothetical protein